MSENKTPGLPSVRRSLVLSFAQKYTMFLLSLPTIMILSRLLTPAEIGIYSVAAAFLLLVQMLRDFGVSDYLVQVEQLNEEEERSAFTVTLLIAWLLAGLLFLSSPWIAAFFNEPLLSKVVKVLSITFLLIPFCSTTKALLQRAMEFGVLYRINVASQAAQSSLTILLAFLGFGVMGLAWGAVGGMVATLVGCLFWGRSYRIKGMSLSRWRPVADFGVQRTFSDAIIKLGVAAPDFVIGRMIGMAQVGLYSRGFGLVRMFQDKVFGAISAVAYPAFARDHREAGKAHLLLLKALSYVTAIGLPFFAFAALMAFPIMRIMFGSQWDAAVPVLQFLAIAAFVQTLGFGVGRFFIAIGKVGLVTRTVTIIQVLRISTIIFAAFNGLYAVAASQIAVNLLAVLLWYFFLLRQTDVTLRNLWNALRQSVWVTVSSTVGPLLVYIFLPPSEANLWVPLLLAGTTAGLGWLVGMYVTKHPLWAEVENAVLLYRRRKVA